MEEFSNRNVHPANAPGHNPTKTKGHKMPKDQDFWTKITGFIGIFALAVLLIATIVLAASGKSAFTDNESQYIIGDRLQAVFLNTGQVYFGNLDTANNNYFVLSDIYYLQTSSSSSSTSSSTSSSNVSLVKLGCELHQPYDKMIINRDEVTFWENLKPTGEVATAVANFQKSHPGGEQNCSDQSSAASTSSGSSTQNAGTTSTSGTSTTGTTTTTK